MAKNHYEEIDILKGIAIAMVILGHAVIRYPINLHEVAWTKAVYDWVETMHMPLFFLISGYCYSFRGAYRPFLKKKIQRILIPYVVFNLIDCVPRAALSFLVNRPKSITESITSILFYGGEYWFLYALFAFFVLFPLVSPYVKSIKARLILVFVALLLKFVPNLPQIFIVYRMAYHFFYFAVGFALKEVFQIDVASSWVENHKFPSAVLAGMIVIAQVFLIPVYVSDYNQVYGVSLALIGIVLCYVMTVLIKLPFIRNLFCEFGKYSLQLYLLNGFMLVLSRQFVVGILGISKPAVILAVNMFFDLLVSYWIIKYVFARAKLISVLSGMA